MKIGIIVDGVSEFASLVELYPQLRELTGNDFLRPVRADIQPKAPIGVIARQCARPARQYAGRGAARIIVIIDREDRSECPGELATAIAGKIAATTAIDVCVVIKDRAYENWIVADLRAVRASRGRFVVSKATERAVAPDKADLVSALELLKRSTIGDAYDKVRDSKRILAQADPSTIAENSRSFRRFLRCAGALLYSQQSKQPVGAAPSQPARRGGKRARRRP